MLAFFILTSCSNAQDKSAHDASASEKVLIVYLSRTNNTKAIAEIIHQQVGGDLVAIEMQKPYPADYKTTVAQVSNENESGFLPLLKTKIENMNQYDMVFVGFPTWGMALPPPMKSFLRHYNFKGKTIVPFGDAINIFPGVKHWHGASPDTPMVHIAITINTENGMVNWLEPVTDEQYNA